MNLCCSVSQYADFISKDCERIKSKFNKSEHSKNKVVIDSYKISLHEPVSSFIQEYKKLCSSIIEKVNREEINVTKISFICHDGYGFSNYATGYFQIEGFSK